MSKKSKNEANLPPVSKQTAGGITGAAIGGIVGGPVGAVAGGIAGALIGNSSAKGNEPMKKAVEEIRSVGSRGAKAIKAARDRNKSSHSTKQPAKGPAAKTAASKPALARQQRTAKPATKKVPDATESTAAAKPKAKRIRKRAKKKG